jgi:hypothetical protein
MADYPMSDDERQARDLAWSRRWESTTANVTAREGEVWDEAWMAARAYYAPNADEANGLRERLGLA